MERLYDLYYVDKNGQPSEKIGKQNWKPMPHAEALTARSKFRNPAEIMLVEVVDPVRKYISQYKVVLKTDHNFVMALFSSRLGGEKYIAETLPMYIEKGFLVDKTLVASDFEVIPCLDR